MNLGEMVTELRARGYDYLSDTRAYAFVNQAANDLDNMMRWPYLYKTASGPSPLLIADLGSVESVTDTVNNVRLDQCTVDEALATYGDLTTTGTPAVWYLTWNTGAASVNTYPAGGTVKVRYWKVTTGLAADLDEPESPSRFHLLICDIAARYAAADAHDWAGVQMLQQQIDRGVQVMAAALLRDQGPTYVPAVGDDN